MRAFLLWWIEQLEKAILRHRDILEHYEQVNLIQKLEYAYTSYEIETSQRQYAVQQRITFKILKIYSVFYDKGIRLEINKNKLSM